MNKTATNILGIIIVILAGTYFFIMYCNQCSTEDEIGFGPKPTLTELPDSGLLS